MMRYDAPHGVALGSTREERLKVVPLELDKMTDAALRYRPKNKAKNLRPKNGRRPNSVMKIGSQSDSSQRLEVF